MTEKHMIVASQVRIEFIEMMGRVFQDEGLPRISGRIFGLLLFDGEPYSFGDIAKELSVSRGSVSTNTRSLLQKGAIVKTSKPAERQDYFIIHQSPFQNIIDGAIKRAEQTALDINKLAEILSDDNGAKERITNHAKYYEITAQKMSEIF